MTLEEFKAEIVKDPTTVATALAYVVTLPEGIEVLENYTNKQKPAILEAGKADILKQIEGPLATVLGSSRPEGITFETYIENVGKELKKLREDSGKSGDEASKQKIKELEGELTALKSANWEGKYNNMVTETSTKIGEYETTIKNLETANIQGLVGTDLSSALSSLSFNAAIPKEAIEAMTSQLKSNVLKNAKVVDGKPVYFNEDGTPMLNDVFKPITAVEIFKKNMATVLAVGNGGGGAPSKPGQGGGGQGGGGSIVTTGEGDKAVKKLVLDPAKFNTKLSFSEHVEDVLSKEGIEKGSKDWNDMINTARTEYEVDKMDRV